MILALQRSRSKRFRGKTAVITYFFAAFGNVIRDPQELQMFYLSFLPRWRRPVAGRRGTLAQQCEEKPEHEHRPTKSNGRYGRYYPG
jgi:hypothetical protein